MKKTDFPVHKVRQYLEPGPIVLVSSHHEGRDNVMTLGWHTVLEFSPSLVGLMIWNGDHSHEMIKRSKECVINVPDQSLIDTVVKIGNCSGADTDKFKDFELKTDKAVHVSAPLLSGCFASFECKIHDDALVDSYNFFIFEVVKAHVAENVLKTPHTIHYKGEGQFAVLGNNLDKKALFKPEMLN